MTKARPPEPHRLKANFATKTRDSSLMKQYARIPGVDGEFRHRVDAVVVIPRARETNRLLVPRATARRADFASANHVRKGRPASMAMRHYYGLAAFGLTGFASTPERPQRVVQVDCCHLQRHWRLEVERSGTGGGQWRCGRFRGWRPVAEAAVRADAIVVTPPGLTRDHCLT